MEDFYILRWNEKLEMMKGVIDECSEKINDIYLEIYKGLIRKEEGSKELAELFLLKFNPLTASMKEKSLAIHREIIARCGVK
jgi:hypothetical protein